MASKRTNPDFLNGVPELLILKLLARKPMHGYQLVQAIRLATNESFAFGEGCVYPILHRLEAERLLKACQVEVGARARVVYHITSKGRKQLAEKTAAWELAARAIRRVLEGGEHGRVEVA